MYSTATSTVTECELNQLVSVRLSNRECTKLPANFRVTLRRWNFLLLMRDVTAVSTLQYDMGTTFFFLCNPIDYTILSGLQSMTDPHASCSPSA